MIVCFCLCIFCQLIFVCNGPSCWQLRSLCPLPCQYPSGTSPSPALQDCWLLCSFYAFLHTLYIFVQNLCALLFLWHAPIFPYAFRSGSDSVFIPPLLPPPFSSLPFAFAFPFPFCQHGVKSKAEQAVESESLLKEYGRCVCGSVSVCHMCVCWGCLQLWHLAANYGTWGHRRRGTSGGPGPPCSQHNQPDPNVCFSLSLTLCLSVSLCVCCHLSCLCGKYIK